MNCNPFMDQFAEYVEGSLPEADRNALLNHLQTCPACRAESDQLMNLHHRLLRDGHADPAPSLAAGILAEIQMREPAKTQNPIWRFLMTHKITAFTIGTAACITLAATLTWVFAHPVEPPTIAADPATNFPPPASIPSDQPRTGGRRPLVQRITNSDAVARAIVQQAGVASPSTGQGDVDFKIIRILYGRIPGDAVTIRVSLPFPLRNEDSIGKEQIIFLRQFREENGQMTAQYQGANYTQLDALEKEITAIDATLKAARESGK